MERRRRIGTQLPQPPKKKDDAEMHFICVATVTIIIGLGHDSSIFAI